MALPASQTVSILYTGGIVAASTPQLVSAITGMMMSGGWTTTGAGTLRSATDAQGRFYEMDVFQSTGASLSNQIQFGVYKHTKAEDPTNYFINRGFQVSTGSTYKIHVTPFSVYCEMNNPTLGQGNCAFAWQLYTDPLTSAQLPFSIWAGGHRNFAGGITAFINARLGAGGHYFNGTSGAIDQVEEWYSLFSTRGDLAQFRGGRIFMVENWIGNNSTADPVQGRPYALLCAGGNGLGGFEIPSGTGTISYVRIDAVSINNSWNYYLRIT